MTQVIRNVGLLQDGDIVSGNNPLSISVDEGQLDAFGRLRVSDTGQRFDVEFIYDKQDELMDEVIVGAGTVTHQGNGRDLLIEANSTTNGDGAEMCSHPIPYTPGNSQLIAITGTLNEASLAGGTVEVFLRSKVTGSVVETVTTQTSWNVNTMVGVDWTKSQILEIDFQSLKVGRIRFALNQGGVIMPFHTIENDNLRASGYWQTPSLPLYWRCYNDATDTYCEMGYGNADNGIGIRYKVTADASAQLRAICGTVKSEGGKDLLDLDGYTRIADMGVTSKSVGTTLIPLISIRPKSTFKTFDNLGLVIPIDIAISVDNPVRLVVVHNPTLVGASWTDVDAVNSHTEYDVSATSYSNGHEIFSDYVSTAKNTSGGQNSLLGRTLLWDRQGTDTGILTVCAVRTTGTSSDTLISFRFKEIR